MPKMIVKLGEGFIYSDDDEYLDDIDEDNYEEEHFSLFQGADDDECRRNRNKIIGGPQPPDVSGMTK